jgi:hypothetical protein
MSSSILRCSRAWREIPPPPKWLSPGKPIPAHALPVSDTLPRRPNPATTHPKRFPRPRQDPATAGQGTHPRQLLRPTLALERTSGHWVRAPRQEHWCGTARAARTLTKPLSPRGRREKRERRAAGRADPAPRGGTHAWRCWRVAPPPTGKPRRKGPTRTQAATSTRRHDSDGRMREETAKGAVAATDVPTAPRSQQWHRNVCRLISPPRAVEARRDKRRRPPWCVTTPGAVLAAASRSPCSARRLPGSPLHASSHPRRAPHLKVRTREVVPRLSAPGSGRCHGAARPRGRITWRRGGGPKREDDPWGPPPCVPCHMNARRHLPAPPLPEAPACATQGPQVHPLQAFQGTSARLSGGNQPRYSGSQGLATAAGTQVAMAAEGKRPKPRTRAGFPRWVLRRTVGHARTARARAVARATRFAPARARGGTSTPQSAWGAPL